jgi:hypothetical protein
LAPAIYYMDPIIPIVSLLVTFALTYVFRQLGWTRAPFNDLRNKKGPKYKEFFARYCNSFREVFSGRESSPQSHSQKTVSAPLDQTSPSASRIAGS